MKLLGTDNISSFLLHPDTIRILLWWVKKKVKFKKKTQAMIISDNDKPRAPTPTPKMTSKLREKILNGLENKYFYSNQGNTRYIDTEH